MTEKHLLANLPIFTVTYYTFLWAKFLYSPLFLTNESPFDLVIFARFDSFYKGLTSFVKSGRIAIGSLIMSYVKCMTHEK